MVTLNLLGVVGFSFSFHHSEDSIENDTDASNHAPSNAEDMRIDGHRAVSLHETTGIKTADAAAVMFKAHHAELPPILESFPNKVQRNAGFLLNLKNVRDPKDFRSDGNGVWTQQVGARKTSLYDEKDDAVAEVSKVQVQSKLRLQGFDRLRHSRKD